MTLKQLFAAAKKKAMEAKAIYENETPDMDAAKALLDEAEGLRQRALMLKSALSIVDEADQATKVTDDKATGGLVVTADETDKKIEHAAPYKSMGEFLQAVARGDDTKELRALKGKDPWAEGGYSVEKAVGEAVVGSLNPYANKAITGMSELVPADGGLLVGTDRQQSILARTYNVGELLQRVDTLGISANSNGMTFFREAETSRATGSRRGGIRGYWAAEGDEKTASQPTFEEFELKLNKLVALVYATDELMADASALEGWIMSNLPEELRFLAEDSIYRGTGAGMPTGILSANCLVTVPAEAGQVAATLISENVINMWARRWLGARDYVWLINQDVTPQLHQMNLGVGTGGQLTYMPPGGLSSSSYGALYGRPVIENEYSSTLGTVGDIVLASLSEYQMIEKGGIQSASSIHVRFIYDEQVFRFVYRVDGGPKWSAALTPFQGTNTVSPFVTLAVRA
jgi:HK97 family phage major capsid protein